MSDRKTFSERVRGTPLVALEAMRDEIAADLHRCKSMKDRAALYRRIIKTMLDIKALRSAESAPDAVGRIKARRGGHRWPVPAGPPEDIPLLE
jgi:hypothetical protein